MDTKVNLKITKSKNKLEKPNDYGSCPKTILHMQCLVPVYIHGVYTTSMQPCIEACIKLPYMATIINYPNHTLN